MVKSHVSVTRYIRKLRGLSKPFLAEASDGHLYVVKPVVKGSSKRLFNEAMGTELYRVAGLNVPAWRPLLLESHCIEDLVANKVASTPDELEPRLVFGSRFIGASFGHLLEILPGRSFNRIRNRTDLLRALLIDICAHHEDNRQVIFKQYEDGSLEAVFIDHGHLFGKLRNRIADHCVASRYWDRRIYTHFSGQDICSQLSIIVNTDFESLLPKLDALPEEWRSEASMEAFRDCLDSLRDANILRSVADAIQGVLGGDSYSEMDRHFGIGSSNAAILYSPLSEVCCEPGPVGPDSGRGSRVF